MRMDDQVFPVQPEDGRFHVLPGPIPELPLVHIRIRMNELCVDVLLGATAYNGSLLGTNAFVRGLPDSPQPALVATLLSIAKTRARVMKRDPDGDVSLSAGCTHKLELSCWDDDGVELAIIIGLRETDASPVVETALSGLLRATGALEAVVKAIEMERTTAGVTAGDKMTAAQVLDAATRPTMIKGKDISSHPAYRRYVARDVAQIGSRAYFCAAEAVKLGDEMRRVIDEKRNKDRRLRVAKRELKKAMERAKSGSDVVVVKTKKKESFFVDGESEDEQATQDEVVQKRKAIKDENVPMGERGKDVPNTLTNMKVYVNENMGMGDKSASSSLAGNSQKKKQENTESVPSQSEKKEVHKPLRKKKKKRRLI